MQTKYKIKYTGKVFFFFVLLISFVIEYCMFTIIILMGNV